MLMRPITRFLLIIGYQTDSAVCKIRLSLSWLLYEQGKTPFIILNLQTNRRLKL